jgi:3-isopropylmalate dehydrogenase
MNFNIAVLPGDGIGPDVTAEAIKVLQAIGKIFGHRFEFSEAPVGGAALDSTGIPLPEETIKLCRASDAIMLGAVGGPRWDTNPPELKPEQALLGLRKGLGLFANLRPAKIYASLSNASSLKADVIEGVDILVVRELTGGLYFGKPRGIDTSNGERFGVNTLIYHESEIKRIATVAFEAARKRKKKVCSVDKANVLETSQLWREVVNDVSAEYTDIDLTHMYVDNCAMQLIRNPRQFDVIVTENMFGDILSDAAAMLTGSIGMLPSASIGGDVALYEPVHGSAPDIAGKNIANPIAAIASAAMMLKYSFNMNDEAMIIERAIDRTLAKGIHTADIFMNGQTPVSTLRMASEIIAEISTLTEISN